LRVRVPHVPPSFAAVVECIRHRSSKPVYAGWNPASSAKFWGSRSAARTVRSQRADRSSTLLCPASGLVVQRRGPQFPKLMIAVQFCTRLPIFVIFRGIVQCIGHKPPKFEIWVEVPVPRPCSGSLAGQASVLQTEVRQVRDLYGAPILCRDSSSGRARDR
jgi:hypothetical protein